MLGIHIYLCENRFAFHFKNTFKCVCCHRKNMKFIPKKDVKRNEQKLPSLLAK